MKCSSHFTDTEQKKERDLKLKHTLEDCPIFEGRLVAHSALHCVAERSKQQPGIFAVSKRK